MAARQGGRAARPKAVADYEHTEAKRLNNPPAGLAREDVAPPPTRSFRATSVDEDPRLPPELVWWGKEDSDESEVEAPSIHTHEALTTEAIIAAVKRESAQPSLFADPELDRSQQVAFYEHEGKWRNRLVLGDSLTVMASLLERERLGGRVQMIYIDPPYGINYNSNFQASISNPKQPDNADESLPREPEPIQAYRDTWEKGVHSYLTYLRERLVAARELLAASGSLFVQIGDDYVHRVRDLLDEVMGPDNCVSVIAMQKSGSSTSNTLPNVLDYILWYARDAEAFKGKFRPLYEPFDLRNLDTRNYRFVEDRDGNRRPITAEERRNPASISPDLRPFRLVTATSQDPSKTRSGPYERGGVTYWPDKEKGRKRHWSVSVPDGLDRLAELGRLDGEGGTLQFIRYLDDFPVELLRNVWLDTGRSGFGEEQRFVVQTNPKAIERCVLMATEPGDLVFDPTCGSGTSAWVAEKHGRRWITTDTSRVAISIARERLLTAKYDYYALANPDIGVDGGLRYEAVRRVQPKLLAEDLPIPEEPLRNRPIKEQGKVRVSGPFTVEALSRYADNPFLDEATAREEGGSAAAADDHVTALLDALRSMGIPRRSASPARVTTLRRIASTGALQAEGTFVNGGSEEEHFGVSLGPRHGPVTVQQVDEALADAYGYSLIVFAGFAATAEAQEYLRSGQRGRFKVALLEANADLLLSDLLKNTRASQTFRLFSSPDVTLHREEDGEVSVELLGMDSFDAATGRVESRDRAEIAAWFLDHSYDGLVFHVNQAFFTRSNAWDALGKALKGTVEPEVLEAMHRFVSLPFTPGQGGKVAVRVVDDAGQTSEAIVSLEVAD